MIILLLIYLSLAFILEEFIDNLSLRILITLIHIIIVTIFIIILIYIIRHSLKQLMNSKSTGVLIVTYIIFLLSIILVLSTVLNILELAKLGYITHGQCTDSFKPAMVNSDPLRSHSFFYFTAMTFFTVGYGDICPMGLIKILSIIIALVGHVLSVIVVVLIINNYIRIREDR